jgi:arabinofuranosyltransferase
MKDQRLLLTITIVCLLLFAFFRNAWISDDALITFRSLDQLLAGNGPRWNAYERVQAYTSPAWFFLLAGMRLFIADPYFAAIALSLSCCAMAVYLMHKSAGPRVNLLLALMALLASPSVIDFTTSGLENPLGYLLATAFFVVAHRFQQQPGRQQLLRMLLVAGLTPLVRHDFVLVIWPATLLLLVDQRANVVARQLLAYSVIASLPFALWTIFSTIYYGLPFPNTAYAKLNTGIDQFSLIKTGATYTMVSLRDDPISAVLLAGAIAIGWQQRGLQRALTNGMLLHLAYVVYVGGDFMRGRFLSVDILLAALMLAHANITPTRTTTASCAGLVLLALVLNPYSALFASGNLTTATHAYESYIQANTRDSGVIDEKNYYYRIHGLVPRLLGTAENNFEELCYFFTRCIRREVLQQCPPNNPPLHCTFVMGPGLGHVGYYAGTNARIIDAMALTDPLLAQLPAANMVQRVGHYQRNIPRGYAESIANGTNQITDERIARLYDNIKLITQSDTLFSAARWRAIVALNTGKLRRLAHTEYQ